VEEGAAVVGGDDDVTEEAIELISCPETELTTIKNRKVSTTTTERLGRRQGSEVDDVGLGEKEDEVKEQEQEQEEEEEEEEGRIAAAGCFCDTQQLRTHNSDRMIPGIDAFSVESLSY
jgi:hypothetical protein